MWNIELATCGHQADCPISSVHGASVMPCSRPDDVHALGDIMHNAECCLTLTVLVTTIDALQHFETG